MTKHNMPMQNTYFSAVEGFRQFIRNSVRTEKTTIGGSIYIAKRVWMTQIRKWLRFRTKMSVTIRRRRSYIPTCIGAFTTQ